MCVGCWSVGTAGRARCWGRGHGQPHARLCPQTARGQPHLPGTRGDSKPHGTAAAGAPAQRTCCRGQSPGLPAGTRDSPAARTSRPRAGRGPAARGSPVGMDGRGHRCHMLQGTARPFPTHRAGAVPGKAMLQTQHKGQEVEIPELCNPPFRSRNINFHIFLLAREKAAAGSVPCVSLLSPSPSPQVTQSTNTLSAARRQLWRCDGVSCSLTVLCCFPIKHSLLISAHPVPIST